MITFSNSWHSQFDMCLTSPRRVHGRESAWHSSSRKQQSMIRHLRPFASRLQNRSSHALNHARWLPARALGGARTYILEYREHETEGAAGRCVGARVCSYQRSLHESCAAVASPSCFSMAYWAAGPRFGRWP